MKNLRLDAGAPVVIVGLPDARAMRQIQLMRDYGTRIVGCVAANADAGDVAGIPVFPSCTEALSATGATAAVTMVPPDVTGHAVLEAAEAGVNLIVSPTFLVPVHDTMRVRQRIRELGTIWLGPGSAGIAIPANAINLGIIPRETLLPGNIGVLAKHSTLSFEVGHAMVQQGLGQSVWIGLGIHAMKGPSQSDLVPFFAQDRETIALLIVGGLGGTDEEDLADALRQHQFEKPVLALLSGEAAVAQYPRLLRSLQTRSSSSFVTKRTALEGVGVAVYDTIDDLVGALPDNR